MARLAAILMLLLASAPAPAQEEPLRVSAELSSQTMNVTQRTTLTVTAEIAEGWVLVSDPFESMRVDDEVGPMLVASAPRTAPAVVESGWTNRSWTIELSPDLPEAGQIPALRFKAVRLSDDRIAIERTDPIAVVVESLLESAPQTWDPTVLRPPLDPIPAPEQSNAAVAISAGAVAVVVALALTATLIGKRRRDPDRLRERRFNAYLAHLRAIDTSAPLSAVAEESHRIVRQAIAEVAGPRAMAVVGADFPALLRQDAGLAPTDAAMVCDYFASVEKAMYAGADDSSSDAPALITEAQRSIESVRLAWRSGVGA